MNYVCACEHGHWHLQLWPKGKHAPSVRVPYHCRSWRHAGDCRQWKGAQDFVRIKEALDGEKQWVSLVLTFAQRDWPNAFAQYKAGGKMWGALQKRIVRRYDIFKYIQTWERFKKGGVHVNVVLYNPALVAAVETDWREWRRDFLVPACVEVGFGKRCWVKIVEPSGGRMAGYLSKLSRELTGGGKGYQIPIDAPPHFRRVRASHHTLPPAYKGDIEGRLVQLPLPT